jgi:release factor glutamine methyltransferase
MTVKDALTRGTDQLSAHPELRGRALPDAAMLLMHALGVSRTELIAHPEREFRRDDQVIYQGLIERRLRFEPIQYIVGEQEFYGLPFRVDGAVLIPRPETELLVEAVLGRVSGAVRIVDVGTGSGAIAVTLAKMLPEATVTGVDLSVAALAVARENAARNGTAVRMLESDLLGAVAGERFEVVVSNPPYIPEGDRPTLHAEVREFEPEGALFAGVEGMDVYRRLVPAAAAVLTPGGLLAMEFGYGQREALRELLLGWDGVEFLDDLQGIPRVVVARLRPAR